MFLPVTQAPFSRCALSCLRHVKHWFLVGPLQVSQSSAQRKHLLAYLKPERFGSLKSSKYHLQLLSP